MTRTVYMLVTEDEYELPIKIADSAEELANILGIKKLAIQKHMYGAKVGRVKKPKYVKVVYED